MVKFNGVNHLAFATGDMDATIRYWRDLLGMKLVAGLGRPGFRHYFFELSDRDTVAFFEWPEVEPLPRKDHGRPVSGPFGFDHVSFCVSSADELWEIRDRLTAAGFWVSNAIDHGFIHSIYTFDPNGIPIEFSYNVEGIDVRANPFMSDVAPVETAMEGSEPVGGEWPRVLKPTPPSARVVYPGAGSEFYHYLRQRESSKTPDNQRRS